MRLIEFSLRSPQSESEILWMEGGIVLSPRSGIRIDDIGSPMSSAAFRSF